MFHNDILYVVSRTLSDMIPDSFNVSWTFIKYSEHRLTNNKQVITLFLLYTIKIKCTNPANAVNPISDVEKVPLNSFLGCDLNK